MVTKIGEFRMYYSTFQMNNIYKSENILDEVWYRIERLSSISILNSDFKTDTNDGIRQELIKYISTRINQAVEFRNASKAQTLLSKPLSLYYSIASSNLKCE